MKQEKWGLVIQESSLGSRHHTLTFLRTIISFPLKGKGWWQEILRPSSVMRPYLLLICYFPQNSWKYWWQLHLLLGKSLPWCNCITEKYIRPQRNVKHVLRKCQHFHQKNTCKFRIFYCMEFCYEIDMCTSWFI